MGNTVGDAGQDNSVVDPVMGSLVNTHATASVACRWEKYSLLVNIFTARDSWALKPHVWVEDLLKDFFPVDIGNQFVSDSIQSN